MNPYESIMDEVRDFIERMKEWKMPNYFASVVAYEYALQLLIEEYPSHKRSDSMLTAAGIIAKVGGGVDCN